MISLITGLPGSGKTSLMVYMLMTRADLKNRPLYVDGIPELKIPTMDIPDGESMQTWHNWAPAGSVLVIDEAQRIFRPRPAGAKVPDYIQELETHRHRGIDIFVMTQHPRLIDVNLRSLIGEHRNISRTMLGFKRVSYWQKCANPESRNDVAEAKNSIYIPKKAAFGMYKSAEEHNKIKGVLSSWIWLLPLLVGLIIYLSVQLAESYDKKTNQQTEQVQEQIQQPEQPEQPIQHETITAASQTVPVDYNSEVSASAAEKVLTRDDFEPTIEGQPWTAPIYNGLNRNVQSMPYPAGCLKSGRKCICYTEQGSIIEDLEKGFCEKVMKNGLYNPYVSRDNVQPSKVIN